MHFDLVTTPLKKCLKPINNLIEATCIGICGQLWGWPPLDPYPLGSEKFGFITFTDKIDKTNSS
ncbi:hypothetical protein J2TS4_13470 [Paenibacillus sp. J2TS4]|nr:hypothetical protein J2TS4_13470 [Paenibacillus sp. J2TS4]